MALLRASSAPPPDAQRADEMVSTGPEQQLTCANSLLDQPEQEPSAAAGVTEPQQLDYTSEAYGVSVPGKQTDFHSLVEVITKSSICGPNRSLDSHVTGR